MQSLQKHNCIFNISGLNQCNLLSCGFGQECLIDKHGITECVCPKNCEAVVRPGELINSQSFELHQKCVQSGIFILNSSKETQSSSVAKLFKLFVLKQIFKQRIFFGGGESCAHCECQSTTVQSANHIKVSQKPSVIAILHWLSYFECDDLLCFFMCGPLLGGYIFKPPI